MATGLDRLYDCIARPSSLLNSIFMSTVNMAAKMLVSVASSSKAENTEKWKLTDHLRFMVMLITWVMLWALRFLMDLFPCSLSSSPDYLLGSSLSVGPFQVAPYSSAGAEAEAEALSSSGSSLDLILRNTIDVDGPAVKALLKSLTHCGGCVHLYGTRILLSSIQRICHLIWDSEEEDADDNITIRR